MRNVLVRDASRELAVGMEVELMYPSSESGQDVARHGKIEKMLKDGILVKVDEGQYRTFKFTRITYHGIIVIE